MSTIAVVADPQQFAALEQEWVLGAQKAILVDRGVCAIHPAPSRSSAHERALAFVRSLRHTAGEARTDAPSADILTSVLATAERTGPSETVIDRSAAMLSGPYATRFLSSALAAPASLLVGANATALAQLAASPRDLLAETVDWVPGTRTLHWEDLLATNTNVLIRHRNDHVTGLHLYGLVNHACAPFTVLLDEDVQAPTIVEEMFSDRVYRMPAVTIASALKGRHQ